MQVYSRGSFWLFFFFFCQQYFQLRCSWIFKLKQKETFNGICQYTIKLFMLGRNSIPILLHFQKLPLRGPLENTCGKSSIFVKVVDCKNYSKVCPHFQKIVYSLSQILQTCSETCIFFVKQYIYYQKQSVGGALKVLVKSLKTVFD